MSYLLQYLVQHGPMLLAGSSLLLAAGTFAVFVQRSPVHRQRSGELTALAVLVWLVLANLPLPRLSLEHWTPMEANDPIQQLSVTPLPTAGLAEQDETTDDAEFIVVTTDESAGVTAQYRQDSVMPEPDNAVERLELQNHATAHVVPAAVTVVPAVTAPIQYVNWFAAIFLTGVGVCVLWLLLGRLLLWRMLRRAGRPDDWLLELYQTLPCRRRPELLISQRASRAFSFGLVRPVIVLPKGCCSAANVDQLRAVLLHELAHSEQGDAWGRLLFNAAFPLLNFHPLYWVIRRRTFMAAELIADDRAAAQTSRASYTQQLIALVRASGRVRIGHLGAMPVFESRTRFSRRMEMLMRRENCLPYRCTPSRRAVYAVLFVMVVAVSGSLLGIAPIQAHAGKDIATDFETGTVEEGAGTDEVEAAAKDEADVTGAAPPHEIGPPMDEAASTEARPSTASLQQQLQRASRELTKLQRAAKKRNLIPQLRWVGESFRPEQINPETIVYSTYRFVLGRKPNEQELRFAAREFRRHLATAADRKKAILDLFSFLANTKEFEELTLLNHLRAASKTVNNAGTDSSESGFDGHAVATRRHDNGGSSPSATRALDPSLKSRVGRFPARVFDELPSPSATRASADPFSSKAGSSPASSVGRTSRWGAFPSAPRATTDRSKTGKPAVPAGTRKSLDLIQLSTAYVDAVGVMELAELRTKRLDQLYARNAVSQ